jgi:hypothetical protein
MLFPFHSHIMIQSRGPTAWSAAAAGRARHFQNIASVPAKNRSHERRSRCPQVVRRLVHDGPIFSRSVKTRFRRGPPDAFFTGTVALIVRKSWNAAASACKKASGASPAWVFTRKSLRKWRGSRRTGSGHAEWNRSATSCRSAAGHLFQLFRVAGPLHRDL